MNTKVILHENFTHRLILNEYSTFHEYCTVTLYESWEMYAFILHEHNTQSYFMSILYTDSYLMNTEHSHS